MTSKDGPRAEKVNIIITGIYASLYIIGCNINILPLGYPHSLYLIPVLQYTIELTMPTLQLKL